jgi:UDPglucose 6-dehydrogenase
MNIVVIGVGYVGLITGLGLAKFNNSIQFLDIDIDKIKKLKNKEAPFFEPSLNEFLNDKEISNSISFFSNYDDIDWSQADIIMICVQTPSSEKDSIDTSFVKKVFHSISKFINEDTILCIKSTIHPEALKDTLQSMGISENQTVFNPEFLREGSAFSDFFNPDRIIIGSSNIDNGKKVASLYNQIDTEILFTDPISSQLIKYLSNAYLPLRLSFINEAAQIVKELDGNLKDTLEGVGLDSRIGSHYFRPSPGWGGSCFPKDVKEINSIAKLNNLNTPLISNINESNSQHQKWFSEYLINLKEKHKLTNICLIGLAFKENTDDIRYSPSIAVYKILEEKNENVLIFDFKFKSMDSLNIISELNEDTLFVEMFPLDTSESDFLTKKLTQLNNFEYLRFWD